jgi:hypothetical protein
MGVGELMGGWDIKLGLFLYNIVINTVWYTLFFSVEMLAWQDNLTYHLAFVSRACGWGPILTIEWSLATPKILKFIIEVDFNY